LLTDQKHPILWLRSYALPSLPNWRELIGTVEDN
jgi:hypothetical protein